MRSYSVRDIYKLGDQPTMHSGVIYRVDHGTDRAFFNFQISNLETDLAAFTG